MTRIFLFAKISYQFILKFLKLPLELWKQRSLKCKIKEYQLYVSKYGMKIQYVENKFCYRNVLPMMNLISYLFLVANILIANISSNSITVNSFYQQPGQFSQVGTWSRSGKEIHVALNITDGLPTETLRLKNSSPLIVKTRLVSCYGVPKATTLMLGQVM